jgi:uncharacterized repeat protein (TIGR04052 family)
MNDALSTSFDWPRARAAVAGLLLLPSVALGGACGDDDGHDDHVHPPTDAGRDATTTDAGGEDDGGPSDAGHVHDGGVDPGPGDDAGADAGPAPDAGADGGEAPDAGPRGLAIRFAARVGGRPFACGTEYAIPGPAGDRSVTVDDFRFYVHGFELQTEGGDWVEASIADDLPWQNGGVALLDFENRATPCTGTAPTREFVRLDAPAATYTAIRFVLGVPFEQNHQAASAAPAPLNLTDLFWNWQGGYKFVRIDARATVVLGDERPAFAVHLGSTGCDGTPSMGGTTMCAFPNRPTVTLPAFDPARDTIVADFAALVEGLDVYVNGGGASGCMSGRSDPECAEVMRSFGIDFGGEPGAQDFFSVVREGP